MMPGANMDPPRPHSPPRVPPLNPEEFGAALNTIEERLAEMAARQVGAIKIPAGEVGIIENRAGKIGIFHLHAIEALI